jgi:hypothetical protein
MDRGTEKSNVSRKEAEILNGYLQNRILPLFGAIMNAYNSSDWSALMESILGKSV